MAEEWLDIEWPGARCTTYVSLTISSSNGAFGFEKGAIYGSVMGFCIGGFGREVS